MLEAAGIPLVLDDSNGLSIRKGYAFPATLLNEREIHALYLSRLLIIRHTEKKVVHHFDKAVNKIKHLLPNVMKNDIDQKSPCAAPEA